MESHIFPCLLFVVRCVVRQIIFIYSFALQINEVKKFAAQVKCLFAGAQERATDLKFASVRAEIAGC
jgi:hypothetical protein